MNKRLNLFLLLSGLLSMIAPVAAKKALTAIRPEAGTYVSISGSLPPRE